MIDILERLRISPTVTLPKAESFIEAAHAIRQMMIERADAAKEIEAARKERDELSADLGKLRRATLVRPSKRAMLSLNDLLEAMEAMDEKDAPALRILVDMANNLAALS